MATNRIEKSDVTKYRKLVKEARLQAGTIPEFFDLYAKVLKDVFDVTIKFTGYPDRIIDQNSSHNSPIGRPHAWSAEQRADPNIPNSYKCYVGQVEGHLVQNDGEYPDKLFEGYDLFWTFSDIALEFVNGTPNGGHGRGNDFTVDLKMFLEDFPVMYRAYRKEDKIDQANDALRVAIKEYHDQTGKIHAKMVEEDPVVNSINQQIKDLDEVRKNLQVQRANQINALQTKSLKSGISLPEIKNDYLDLNAYNKLRKASEAPVQMVEDQELNTIHKKISAVQKNFNNYKDDFAEDFL